MKGFFLSIGFIYLILLEVIKVYFIMPFPGSQTVESINLAYYVHTHIWWLRIAGICLIVFPLVYYAMLGKLWQKIMLVVGVLFYAVICFFFNFRLLAEKMFYQPAYVEFKTTESDTTDKQTLIIGIANDGVAKAYPIHIIGYHHQVQDSLGNKPVIVTYCTVCRTGRVYSPIVNNAHEYFRLVGMDHFNAMFEDYTTKSWWRQVNGKAIAGKMKGAQLPEIPSVQMTLGDWIEIHPNTLILQGDTTFHKKYEKLKLFDDGTIKSSLEKRDSNSWKNKSWVIGININGSAKAYDWNNMIAKRIIQDSISNVSVLITIEKNNKTFYTFNRNLDNLVLHFVDNNATNLLEDIETHSQWKPNGTCVSGKLSGKHLERIQSYQEFWHSWSYFHPDTKKYIP